MQFAYLLINLAMFVPVLVSSLIPGLPRLEWKRIARGVPLLALVFILWDVWATAQGHWSFSTTHTLGIYVANLPIEEVLFFFTAPLGSWYLLEAIKKYTQEKIILLPTWLPLAIALSLVGVALFFITFQYTVTVSLLSASVFFIWWSRIYKRARVSITSTALWLYAFGFCLFILFNSLLTGFLIVTYGSAHSIGWKIGTIPIEDFLYNFLLLTSILLLDQLTRKERA